jgi:hypothetical protein
MITRTILRVPPGLATITSKHAAQRRQTFFTICAESFGPILAGAATSQNGAYLVII